MTTDREAAQRRIDNLEARFVSYSGGDRPMSPPASLFRELEEARGKLTTLPQSVATISSPDPFAACASFAAKLPLRVISGESGAYLSRYTLCDLPGAGHIFLHYFHRSDEDATLHNHPWSGASLILAGGYREERRYTSDREGHVGEHLISTRTYLPGSVNTLAPDTFHRVDLLDPRGCWTLFAVGERVQSWGFWDRVSGVTTPWREALTGRGLPLDPRGVAADERLGK